MCFKMEDSTVGSRRLQDFEDVDGEEENSGKNVKADKHRRMRKNFSVIEVRDDVEESSSNLVHNVFGRTKHYGRRKSIELKVIETDSETPKSPTSSLHKDVNRIWGSQSQSIDSKNLHPGVAELLEAAFNGDNMKMKQIMRESSESLLNFNSVDPIGRCALHFAVYNNHYDTANLLVNQGVKIDVWDREKKATPLICAAAIGKVSLVQLLLSNGTNVNCGFDLGNTALLWAARSRNLECLQKILEAGAKQNTPVMYCETALHVASANGDYDILKLLLSHDADVMLRKGDEQNTALHLAAQGCNTSCCKLLLKHNINIDAQNSKGETALHLAALKDDVDTVQLLLANGASVKIRNMHGCTPLFYSMGKTGNTYATRCVEALLQYNSDVNCQDNLGLCPLHLAAIQEGKECVQLLINHNADVSIVSKAGTSALSLLLRKIPDTMKFIRNHLDDSVIVNSDTNDSTCKVKLDFKSIAPNRRFLSPQLLKKTKTLESESRNTYAKESDLIKCFLTTGQKEILLHPLVEAFITLKWQKVRKFFYFGILLKVFLVLLFSFLMVSIYTTCDNDTNSGNQMESQDMVTNESESAAVTVDMSLSILTGDSIKYKFTRAEVTCRQRPSWISMSAKYFWLLVICLTLFLIIQELAQLLQSFTTYIRYVDSWLFWLFITTLLITCTYFTTDGTNFAISGQHQSFAAVSVFLGWIFVVLQLGKFPASGTLVQMLIKVSYNFAQFLGVYVCLITAFATAFYILFPLQPAFENPFLAFSKTMRMMMPGDASPEPLIFDTPYPWVAHIMHTVFIVLISILLMNLLIGFAIADIQGMYRDAKLLRLSRQAALIYQLESIFLSPALLKWLPKGLIKTIKENSLILPYLRKGCFHFKPFDHRDVKLPDFLQLSTLQVGSSSGNRKFSEVDTKNVSEMKEVQSQIDEMQAQLKTIMERQIELCAQLKGKVRSLQTSLH